MQTAWNDTVLSVSDSHLVDILFSLIVMLRWNVATAVILLNVLISLFSSAYEDVSCLHVSRTKPTNLTEHRTLGR